MHKGEDRDRQEESGLAQGGSGKPGEQAEDGDRFCGGKPDEKVGTDPLWRVSTPRPQESSAKGRGREVLRPADCEEVTMRRSFSILASAIFLKNYPREKSRSHPAR